MLKKNIIIASLIVGFVMLAFDWIAHITIGNAETFLYYLYKPFLAGVFAFFMFSGMFNFFNLKKHSSLYYGYYATFFALVHGLYYRAIEMFSGAPLFSRGGGVVIGNIVFTGFLMTTFAWWVIHAGAFFVGVMLAKMIVRRL